MSSRMLLRALTSLSVALAGFCIPSGAQQGATEEDLLRNGSQAMQQGKTGDAESYFQLASKKAPTSPEAWFGLGLAQLKEGKGSDAIAALARAVQLNPELAGGHLFLGIALYQQNHPQEAADALNEEIRRQPKSVEALTWLGIVELGSGHAELATSPLDQAAALAPDNRDILYYRGRAHTLVGQAAYQALYKLDPDCWQIHYALGQDFAASGQPAKAITELQAAIAKQPGNADLYEAIGDEYQKVSRFDDAIKAYQEEVKLSPRNGIALYNLGKIQVERGDPAAGVPLLRGAVEANTSPGPTSFYLGLGLAKLGENDEAATWLERSLQSNPSDFIRQGAYYELSRVYQKMNRKEDAQRALEELKKLKDQMAAATPSR